MDPAQMRTKGGALKSPPYVAPGQKRTACLLPPWKAKIIKEQYQPWECRQEFENPLSDGNLEKSIDKCMRLSGPSKLKCENARKEGEEVFTHKFGNRGNIIEVFFNVDLDNLPDKKPISGRETLIGKPLAEVDQIVSGYQQVDLPDGAFYLALDTKYRRLFAYFSKGLEVAYGPRIGKWVLESTTYNIDEYSQVNPPDMPRDKRHSEYEKWLLDNPHLSSAYWSRAGVYHWGTWMERGHNFKGSCLTKDIVSTSSHVVPVLNALMTSFGNITRAKRILLGAVDKPVRDFCQKVLEEYPAEKKTWATDRRECFTLRACLVNVFTEPHYDSGDLDDGWAVMAPMGEFKGGELCIRQLGRRFVYQPGGIGIIRGSRLEHCTTSWSGIRYSLVSTFHESMKKEYEQEGK